MISLNVIQSTALTDDAKAILCSLLEENQKLRKENEELKDQERLICTNEAMGVLGCARKKFWELSNEPDFPKAIKFGYTNYYKLNQLKDFRDNYIDRKTSHAN